MNSWYRRPVWLFLLISGVCAGVLPDIARTARAEGAETQPFASGLDESTFRDGLRRRGLTDWLNQYDADNPATDGVTRQLRRRDDLLAQAADANLPAYERHARLNEASAILTELIAQQVGDARRMTWQLELVRDCLERRDPDAFEAVLLYEAGGRARASVAAASGAAVEAMDGLRKGIQAAWDKIGEMDEQAVAQATASGVLRDLEVIDRQSVMLSVWAELYRAMSADVDEQQRNAAFTRLLEEVTERQGWTEAQAAGQESLRCNALVIAAMASRHLKRFDEGAAYARQIVATMTKVGDPAERLQLRHASLLGILEQIRALRDAGKFTEALAAVAQGRQWAEQSRRDDMSAFLAIAILESEILARQANPQAAAAGWLGTAKALEPIRKFADQSPAHRELAYAAVGLGMGPLPRLPEPTTFQDQLLAGGVLRNLVADLPPEKRRNEATLKDVVRMLLSVATKPPENEPPATVGEVLFLFGRASYLAGDSLEACGVLCDMARKYPKHDRASTAIGQAVAIAQSMLRSSGTGPTAEARGAFLRAARLSRELAPDSVEAKRLQYFIARTLEDGGQLREAAQEYAAVVSEDANAFKATVRRAHCLRSLLQQAAADAKASQGDLRSIAEESLKAAQAAEAFAKNRSAGDAEHCLLADVVLMQADLLNNSLISRHADAEGVLKDFEQRFQDCPDAVGPALRERVLALRQLKKLAEAREVVERFLKADPEHAGPVMARLLEAMRNELSEAADRGDDKAVKELAEEAVRLAEQLLEWSRARPGQVANNDSIMIRVWQAWSLADAGRVTEALPLFRELKALPKEKLPENAAPRMDVRLGEATCLLNLGKPEEAVTLFNGIWQQAPERSPAWWQAFAGNLQCLAKLNAEPMAILQPVAQQRFQDVALGGPRWKRIIESVEDEVRARPVTTRAAPQTPADSRPADG